MGKGACQPDIYTRPTLWHKLNSQTILIMRSTGERGCGSMIFSEDLAVDVN